MDGARDALALDHLTMVAFRVVVLAWALILIPAGLAAQSDSVLLSPADTRAIYDHVLDLATERSSRSTVVLVSSVFAADCEHGCVYADPAAPLDSLWLEAARESGAVGDICTVDGARNGCEGWHRPARPFETRHLLRFSALRRTGPDSAVVRIARWGPSGSFTGGSTQGLVLGRDGEGWKGVRGFFVSASDYGRYEPGDVDSLFAAVVDTAAAVLRDSIRVDPRPLRADWEPRYAVLPGHYADADSVAFARAAELWRRHVPVFAMLEQDECTGGPGGLSAPDEVDGEPRRLTCVFVSLPRTDDDGLRRVHVVSMHAERFGIYDVAVERAPDGGWRVVAWRTVDEVWS